MSVIKSIFWWTQRIYEKKGKTAAILLSFCSQKIIIKYYILFQQIHVSFLCMTGEINHWIQIYSIYNYFIILSELVFQIDYRPPTYQAIANNLILNHHSILTSITEDVYFFICELFKYLSEKQKYCTRGRISDPISWSIFNHFTLKYDMCKNMTIKQSSAHIMRE